jgi:hypothetical protein
LTFLRVATCLVALSQDAPPVRESGPAFTLAARGRVSSLSGDAGDGLDASDFLRTGYGSSLQLSWLADPDRSSLGLWASLGFDRFGGESFNDDLGDRVSVDDLDRFLLLAGGRVKFMFKEPVFRGNPIFIDVRLGGGLALYEEVEADFQVGGVTTEGVEVFDAGLQGAGEAALTVGVDSPTFAFGLGFAVRWLGGPDRGSDVSSFVNPGIWIDLSFELGWEYRF